VIVCACLFENLSASFLQKVAKFFMQHVVQLMPTTATILLPSKQLANTPD
jgi:hypothetical protein